MNRLFNNDDGLKKKFKFNNEIISIIKALGISIERSDELGNIMSSMTKEIDSSSKIIEVIANHEEMNDCEKMFSIFMYGGYVEHLRTKQSSNDSVIVSSLGGATPKQLMKVLSMIESQNPDECCIDELIDKIKDIVDE